MKEIETLKDDRFIELKDEATTRKDMGSDLVWSEMDEDDEDLKTMGPVDPNELYETLTEEENNGGPSRRTVLIKDRQQRFAGLGLAAVGAGIVTLGGALANLFHPSASQADLEEVAHDAHKIMALEEAQIEALNSTLGMSLELIREADVTLEFVVYLLEMMENANLLYLKIGKLKRGLSMLLQQHLSSELVNPEALRKVYASVVKRLAQQGAVPLVPNKLSLYSLSVGHSFDPKTLKFTIRLLVPGEIVGTRMVLLRYVEFPLVAKEENGTATYILPSVGDNLLAVAKEPRAKFMPQFRTIPRKELDNCQKVHNIRVCSLANVYRKTSESRCLEALYGLDMTKRSDFRDHCMLKIQGNEDALVQMTHDTFHVFLHSLQSIKIICQGGHGGHRHQPRQGLLEVTLPNGCHGETADLTFYPKLSFKVANLTVTKGSFKLVEAIEKMDLDAWHKAEKTLLMPSEGMTVDAALKHLEKDVAEQHSHNRTFYLAAATAGAVLVLAGVGILCKCWNCTCSESKPKRSESSASVVYKAEASAKDPDVVVQRAKLLFANETASGKEETQERTVEIN
jgi:hypothetical protein